MLERRTKGCNLVVSADFVSVFVNVLVIESDFSESSVGVYLISIFYLLKLHLLSVARLKFEAV